MTSYDLKKILVLRSGIVAPPCLEYISRNPKNRITLGTTHLTFRCNGSPLTSSACRTLSTTHSLAAAFPKTTAIALDVTCSSDLDTHIAANDVVISLIPYTHHPTVILSAIKSRTNVVTISYISPSMLALAPAVKAAGITVINEVGVDPGVDHIYVVKKIPEVHARGGKVREFCSYCGGLLAPECADNPLGFKFLWSPWGALLS